VDAEAHPGATAADNLKDRRRCGTTQMASTPDNLEKNREHYDASYSQVDVPKLAEKVRDPRAFVAQARWTGSWFGMFFGGFDQRVRGKRVLELGCGLGLNALALAGLGAAEVVAVDIAAQSELIISQVAALLNLENIRAVTGDFTRLLFPAQSYDFVVAKSFVHHLTHDLEEQYVAKVAKLLKPDGEVRWVEPAVNSLWLDRLRWLVPVPGRPSILARKAFAAWKARDPHPVRDNSAAHYQRVGEKYFYEVEITPYGSIDRLHRLMPRGRFHDAFRRWAHRIETRLPMGFRRFAARVNIIVYRRPRPA
jgi:2-polyprenyl-3-methyl-5-hydroxy-6-metoxy-1,4-benzoquinol methylase